MLPNRMAQETRERELETRKAQLFMQINTQWKDRGFIKGFYDMLNLWEWENYEDFWNKYGQRPNVEALQTFVEIWWYFEGVSQLLRDKLIYVRLVDVLFRPSHTDVGKIRTNPAWTQTSVRKP